MTKTGQGYGTHPDGSTASPFNVPLDFRQLFGTAAKAQASGWLQAQKSVGPHAVGVRQVEAQVVTSVAFPFVTTWKDLMRQFNSLTRFAGVIVQSETSLPIEDGRLSSVADKRIA